MRLQRRPSHCFIRLSIEGSRGNRSLVFRRIAPRKASSGVRQHEEQLEPGSLRRIADSRPERFVFHAIGNLCHTSCYRECPPGAHLCLCLCLASVFVPSAAYVSILCERPIDMREGPRPTHYGVGAISAAVERQLSSCLARPVPETFRKADSRLLCAAIWPHVNESSLLTVAKSTSRTCASCRAPMQTVKSDCCSGAPTPICGDDVFLSSTLAL